MQPHPLVAFALAVAVQLACAFEVVRVTDESFEVVGPNARVGFVVNTPAHEGVVYDKKEFALLYSTLPPGQHKGATINRLDLRTMRETVYRHESNNANGMFHDAHSDTLFVCEQGTSKFEPRISATNLRTGAYRVAADRFGGFSNASLGRLNSPNDVVLAADGALWFTDPDYNQYFNFHEDWQENGCWTYRVDPKTGRAAVVEDTLHMPNGLAFAPGGQVLYITDSAAANIAFEGHLPRGIYAFDVHGAHLRNKRLFAVAEAGIADGIKVSRKGFVFAGCFDGISIYNPSGDLIAKLVTGFTIPNFTFDPDEQVLYAATDSSIMQIFLH